MHKIFTAWMHSLGGTFAGGHFHLTAGLAVLILAILAIIIPITRSGSGSEFGRPASGETGVFITVMAALVGIAYWIAHAKPAHPAAAAAVRQAPPVIRKTTIVQHITNLPGHPVLSGWEIVVICIAALVVGLVTVLNVNRGSG